MKRLGLKLAFFLCLYVFNIHEAQGEIELKSNQFTMTYWAGLNTRDGSTSLSRLTFSDKAKVRISRKWRADFGMRLELADDETGLGTTDTYSSISRPLIRTDNVRLEIDRATLTYKSNGTRIVLGKQSVAWGVLDGIQISDQFSPVRQRDFVFSNQRPERISRWGVRAQRSIGHWLVEGAAAFDPTVNQLALPGDAFSPLSPRFRAGLPADISPTSLNVTSRNSFLEDATFGLRVSKKINSSQVSLVGIHGANFSPVFSERQGVPGGVLLDYPSRSLLGVTYDASKGPVVFRLETAFIPDQPLNVGPEATDFFKTIDTNRWLAGVGLDWEAPGDLFLNVQLAIDHVDAPADILFRPTTETIYTVKFRRAFHNDLFVVNGEVLGSAEGGDGALSLSTTYHVNDQLSVSIGSNLLFGKGSGGVFSQFEDQSRIWTRIKLSY